MQSPTRTLAEDSEAQAIRIIQQCAGAPIPVRVLGQSRWTGGAALVAERFWDGRVFLTGDAAHLFTPTGGFGMNTGVDGAANLAWKLAAVIQGWGGSKLLDSYEAERRPIARRNTLASRGFAVQFGALSVGPELEKEGAAGDRARAELGASLEGFDQEFAALGIQLGARYDGSPILPEGGEPPADDAVKYVPSSVPGGRLPHFWMGSGRNYGDSIFDRLGSGFTLLRLGGGSSGNDLSAEAIRRGVPLKILEVSAAEARELYERDLILVRPDQYIAWSGDREPEDSGALWDRLLGGPRSG
jgi:hypothetical protein